MVPIKIGSTVSIDTEPSEDIPQPTFECFNVLLTAICLRLWDLGWPHIDPWVNTQANMSMYPLVVYFTVPHKYQWTPGGLPVDSM